nr:tRNA lysidine(34) synthetase TilS [Phyllobacterium sp. SYP-B3895]
MTSVIVAVSGGSDSLGLLHLLAELRASRPQFPAIIAVTVDHRLRPEAAEEAGYVATLCAELGIKHRTLAWDEPKPQTALSALARDARYRLLCQAAREADTDVILTGHTQDDQIETYAMRRLRTSSEGSDRGLAGMAPATLFEREIWLVRPLLGITREAIRAYLRSRSVAWRDDPSNEDPKYERVRIRKALRNEERASILANIATKTKRRMTHNIGAAALLQKSVAVHDGTLAEIERSAFAGDRDDLRLAVGVLLAAMGGLSMLPAAEICDRAIQHIAGDGTFRRVSLGRCVIEVKRDKAIIYRELRSLPEVSVGAGETAIWDGRYRLTNWTKNPVEIVPVGNGNTGSIEGERPTNSHSGALKSSPAIINEGEMTTVICRDDHAKLPAGIALTRHLSLFDHILSSYDISLARVLAELFCLPPYKDLPVNQINKN